MINGVIIKKISKNSDERGWLAEIYRQDEVEFCPAMAYVSVTKPGVIRGPHEHKFQSDSFVFIGPGNFELYLWDNRKDSLAKGEHIKLAVGENNPVLIVVPPGVVHGYKCAGETDGWCINLPDKLYRGEGKSEEVDEIRWEQDENSPYKIE
ncbi:MAG: dTDP-4-dehydrorhamnose 3,5-epimerase family protein [Patescibacteria group bacterium]|nr:dTDP-4-dehydrorhamnose 3,5-epimerase family protein [Patescibacteria group bacterium]